MEETFNPNGPAMMPANVDIRRAAKATLSGRWLNPVLCTLVYCVVAGVISAIPWLGYVGALLVVCPLGFGYSVAFLRHVRGEEVDGLVTRPFDAFKEYGRYLGTSLLVSVFVMLWTLLLIIPGIIMSYAYSMTPYIMKDNPEMSAMDCIKKSKEMMRGYKWKLFLLDLGFIGWILLGCLTLGIYLLWVEPWMVSARAKFYEELKARQNS